MGYDAFLSYSHAADGRLAPALQRAMQRLAKPWYRPRALRVFRDESALSANPHLWSSIQNALDEAEWFVLLASPDAVASEWVNRELAYWLEHKSLDRILPVVTDGSWEWFGGALVGSAVPPVLADAFVDEPRHVDLRWAHDVDDLDMRNSRFRDAVAQVAAPAHGVAKDDLESEDVRQHRHARRLARGGVSVLVVLVIISIVFGAYALVQRNDAQNARARADERANDATAGRLAALAASKNVSDESAALLLAVEAFNRKDSPTTRAALLNLLTTSPQLVGFVPGPADTAASALSPDGRTVVLGTTSGLLRFWTVAQPTSPSRVVTPPPALRGARISTMTYAANGRRLFVVYQNGQALQLDALSKRIVGPPLLPTGASNVVAVSPDGRRIAVDFAPSSPYPHGALATYDISTGRERQIALAPSSLSDDFVAAFAAFSANGNVLYTSGVDGVDALDANTLTRIGSPFIQVFNTTGLLASATNARGQSYLVAGFGRSAAGTGASLINATTRGTLAELGQPLNVTAVAVSHDASTFLLGGSDGTLTAWSSDGIGLTWPWRAQGGQINSISFADDDQTIVTTAADGSTVLWNISGNAALAFGPQSKHALHGVPSGGGGVALSADGRTVAVTNDDVEVQNLCDGLGVAASLRTNPQACPDMQSILDAYVVVSGVDARPRETTTEYRTKQAENPGNNANGSVPAFASITIDPQGKRVYPVSFFGGLPSSQSGQPSGLRGMSLAAPTAPDANTNPYVLAVHQTNPSETPTTWVSLNMWTGQRTGQFNPQKVRDALMQAHHATRDSNLARTDVVTTNGATVDQQGLHAATISGFGDVVVWDLHTGKPLGAPILASDSSTNASAVAFSPSGDEIAVGRDDGTVLRYSVPALRPLGNPVGGHGTAIREVAYQPHGTLIATASGDRVELIDRSSGTTIATMPFAPNQPLSIKVPTVQFDATGDLLLTQGDLAVRPALLWSMIPSDWVAAACRAAGRNLSRSEWSRLVGADVPYHATCPQWPAGS
jgi:WD40 repeat protein